MEVKYCRAQHEVLGRFIRYRFHTWGPWNQLPLSYWSDCTVDSPNHPSPSQLTRELQRLLTRARLLSEVCCNPISPLSAAVGHASISQEFTDILKELQWSLSVVSNGRVCKFITDKSSPKLKEFPWDTRSGQYEQELLEIAEQQDWRDVMEQLENSDGDHECSAGECGNMHGRSDRRFCLAVQLIEEWRPRQGSSSDDSNHLSTLFSFDEEVLIHGRPLGSGAYGAVTKCTWLGVEYAQKIFGSGSAGLTFLRAEAEALAKLNHPHIVKVHACSESSLLLDLMSTDLYKFIKARMRGGTRDQPFSLQAAVDLILQIADTVRYLHTQGMAHRDLKSSNILVNPVSTSSVDLEDGFVFAKVADFGLAKLKHEITSYSHLTHNMGTRRYMAPEIFGANKDDVHLEHAYPMKADVYSFGVICSEILTGEEPYIDVALSSLYSELTGEIPLRPRLPSSCPSSLSSLICACWHADPRERPAFGDVCKVLKYISGVQTLPGTR